MNTVAVIDFGMGNLHSVAKALERAAEGLPGKSRVIVTSDAAAIREADRVVLPGVGAIRDCMAELRRLELDRVIAEVAFAKPFLGVCVGMQALMEFSDENGGTPCLGLMPGKVRFFGDSLRDPQSGARLKVPHMGWNQVHHTAPHPLWESIPQDERFYFVHSYYIEASTPDIVAGRAHYGFEFTAAIFRGTLFAVQFHPEKSQQAGISLYRNFLCWDGKL